MVSGATLTVIGMTVVFSALGLLALAAWILERLFRAEELESESEVKTPIRAEAETEAVIALALLYHTKRKGSLHLERVNESTWIQQGRVYT